MSTLNELKETFENTVSQLSSSWVEERDTGLFLTAYGIFGHNVERVVAFIVEERKHSALAALVQQLATKTEIESRRQRATAELAPRLARELEASPRGAALGVRYDELVEFASGAALHLVRDDRQLTDLVDSLLHWGQSRDKFARFRRRVRTLLRHDDSMEVLSWLFEADEDALLAWTQKRIRSADSVANVRKVLGLS